MNNSPAPSRSVLKSLFTIGDLTIPICLYKANDRMGLSGQLFHEGCGGKIRQWKTCELHPNTPDPATFSGVMIGEEIVELDKQIKTDLLGGNCNIDAVCAAPMRQLHTLLIDRTVVPNTTYQMAPQEHFEQVFSTFLDRLRISRNFLLVTFPEGSTKRYGILFSSGVFMSLFYEEEIREQKFEFTSPRPELKKHYDALISSYQVRDFPRLTGLEILERVEAWYQSIILKITRSRPARGEAKAKVRA